MLRKNGDLTHRILTRIEKRLRRISASRSRADLKRAYRDAAEAIHHAKK